MAQRILSLEFGTDSIGSEILAHFNQSGIISSLIKKQRTQKPKNVVPLLGYWVLCLSSQADNACKVEMSYFFSPDKKNSKNVWLQSNWK